MDNEDNILVTESHFCLFEFSPLIPLPSSGGIFKLMYALAQHSECFTMSVIHNVNITNDNKNIIKYAKEIEKIQIEISTKEFMYFIIFLLTFLFFHFW